ncbi:MAG: hypothetical protein U9Q33_03430 [Campylobacterota bacterium]|nr:hypothetical protein [Campylobacterota bacterium]
MEKENKSNEVVINEKSMEILVAKFIPTSQYFERSFEMLQRQLEDNKQEQREFKSEVSSKFKQIDKRFEQVDNTINEFKKDVDKRFEQVDKRFEQIDIKFDKVNENLNNITLKIEQLTKSQETTIRDYIIERDRHYDSKFNSLRMFNIATISLVAGVILKMAGIITI